MGSHGWQQGHPVGDSLFEEGHRFGFHQALRLLESIEHKRLPVGEQADPDQEIVRMRSVVRFDFPASEVETIERTSDGRAVMAVNVMGLAGEAGPLPAWVSELLLERVSRGDKTLRDFFDVFNHRLLSLLHRAKKKARPALDPRSPEKSRVASTLFAMMGLGTDHLRRSMPLSERALLPFAGLLVSQLRSAVGLELLLRGYFDAPVTLVPFIGQWETLEESDLTRIGLSGQNQTIGGNAVLGRRVLNMETNCELRIGPLPFAKFLTFLPGRTSARALVPLVRFYTGDAVDFTYRLTLRAADVPPLKLGRQGKAMLGWTTWLRGSAPVANAASKDDEQVHLRGRAA